MPPEVWVNRLNESDRIVSPGCLRIAWPFLYRIVDSQAIASVRGRRYDLTSRRSLSIKLTAR